MKKWTALMTLLMLSAGGNATNYKYNELAIKDYDEMNKMVQERVKKARDVGNVSDDESVDDRAAIEELRDALKLILSRPNTDNMIAKLNQDVRRELSSYSSYEDTMSSIVSEAIDQVKNDKGATSQRTTSLFIVENALSEIKPEAKNNPDMRNIVQRIKDAKIKVAKEILKELRLGSMISAHDPSKQAAEILKAIDGKK